MIAPFQDESFCWRCLQFWSLSHSDYSPWLAFSRLVFTWTFSPFPSPVTCSHSRWPGVVSLGSSLVNCSPWKTRAVLFPSCLEWTGSSTFWQSPLGHFLQTLSLLNGCSWCTACVCSLVQYLWECSCPKPRVWLFIKWQTCLQQIHRGISLLFTGCPVPSRAAVMPEVVLEVRVGPKIFSHTCFSHASSCFRLNLMEINEMWFDN